MRCLFATAIPPGSQRLPLKHTDFLGDYTWLVKGLASDL